MGLLQHFRQKWRTLGTKLLASHLAIAAIGGLILVMTEWIQESLWENMFQVVQESIPRIELLHTIGTRLQHSQIVLQDWVLTGGSTPEIRQRIWSREIWPAMRTLQTQSSPHWQMHWVEKLTGLKALLSEIHLQQWKIADTTNTRGDAPARNLFHTQAFPQAISIRNMIDAMTHLAFIEAENERLTLLLHKLRIALDSSLSALERIGYRNAQATVQQYDDSMVDFHAIMTLLRTQEPRFSVEMTEIFTWLKTEQAAYAALAVTVKKASTNVTQQILSTKLRPLTIAVFATLKSLADELDRQLDHDTQLTQSQSAQVVWYSRLLIILTLLLAVFMARKGAVLITTPLTHLNCAASAFAAENLSQDIPEQGSLELVTLTRSFNAMRRSLQESVGLMRSVLDTAAEAIIRIDDRNHIEAFNEAAQRIFGWRAPEVIGRNISMLMPVVFRDAHANALRRYLTSHAQSHVIFVGMEVQGLTKTGRAFPIHLSVSHVEVCGRNIFTGIISDITGQKKFQADLSAAKDKAEAGSRAKAAFIANMSHEIRTPMNAVIGFASVALEDQNLTPQTARYLQTILSSAKALMEIINGILDISKMESGKFALETVCFHLPNALSDALRTMEHLAQEKNLSLNIDYDDALPTRFMGDPTRLRQVVLNLVGNAIKFTDTGGVSIAVQLQPPQMLHFAITDSGIGMTAEQIDKVFDPFTQADETTTRRFGGTGLGTTISKQIVAMMGGEIWIDSQPGQGSTFHFTAQMREALDTDYCLFAEVGGIPQEMISPRLFHVLLVEDIEANAMLVDLRLKQQGHTVHWVENGRLAVQETQSNAYDLVLMDVQMPELDGIEATKEIRKKEKNTGKRVPVLALTASVMREDNHNCLAAGMDRVVAKPIDFDALFTAMEEIVPEGVGKPNTKRKIDSQTQSTFDFSPLTGVVDYAKALKAWRTPKVYAKALAAFALERKNDAQTIEQLLTQHPDNRQPARGVAHALKGVAGNLAIDRVARLSTEIDGHLKAGQTDAAFIKLKELHHALEQAVAAIHTLRPGIDESDTPVKAFDAKAVRGLLVELSSALDEFDPDPIEPVLQQLTDYVDKADVAPMQHAVKAFDFVKAKAEMNALADKLGLNRS